MRVFGSVAFAQESPKSVPGNSRRQVVGYDTANANALAHLALVAWFPISLALFLWLRPLVATSLTLFLASLLLPTRVGYDLPGLPPFDRETIAVLAALTGCLVVRPGSLRLFRHFGPAEMCVVVLLISPLVTALTNADMQHYGARSLPGLTWWDGPSMIFSQFMIFGAPFLLGSTLPCRSRDLRYLFKLIIGVCLIYSIPILWEVRMSPQLNKIVYGFHSHSFSLSVRGGGFRPMVFMSFGIALATFVASAAVAAAVATRARMRIIGVLAPPMTAYLLVVLILCKSLAAIIYGIVMVPFALFASTRLQVVAATGIAVVVISYPLLRAVNIFPTELLVNAAARIDPERAGSLDFRFVNEDRLLLKARDRISFGWGGWKRNRVFNEITGEDESITDGVWILQIGMLGVVGFVAGFGVILWPILSALRAIKRVPLRDELLVAGLALILAFNAVDQIPNWTLSPFTVFLGGILMNVSRSLRPVPRARRAADDEGTDRSPEAGTDGGTIGSTQTTSP